MIREATTTIDRSKNMEPLDVAGLFAEPLDEDLYSQEIKSESSGGWGHNEYWLHADQLVHSYIRESRIGGYNSHGTDWEWESYETAVSLEEAIRLLRGDVAGQTPEQSKSDEMSAIAESWEDFEAACAKAYEACTQLLKEHLPGCTPQGLLYNNRSTTILRTVNSDDSESAVKICRIPQETLRNIRCFYEALEASDQSRGDSGGAPNIIPIQNLIVAAELPGDDCIAIIQMPLMARLFQRRKNGWVMYQIDSQIDKKHKDKEHHPNCILGWHIEVARALAKIHSLGFVHHDVRPENILIDEDGNVVLADICSIKPLGEQYQGHLQGSTKFRAPELAEHKPYGPDVDVFAWGRTILYSLVGMPGNPEKLPVSVWLEKPGLYYEYYFLDNNCVEFHGRFFEQDPEFVSMMEASVIAQSMDPADRYPSGQELVEALESGLDQPKAYHKPELWKQRDGNTVDVRNHGKRSTPWHITGLLKSTHSSK